MTNSIQKNNQFLAHHRRPGEDREENDYYATHPSSIPPLFQFMGWDIGLRKLFRENSCGAGHLSRLMELYGHTVISSDLIDRGYGMVGVDFLEPHWSDNLPYDAVIMNPPYKHALAFVLKSLEIAPVVCAFFRITFLESKNRKKFFKEHPPRYVAVFSERMMTSKNAEFNEDESSAVCYAWFIWERGYKGKPEIIWI